MNGAAKGKNVFLDFLSISSIRVNKVAEWICVVFGVSLFMTLNIGVFSRYVLGSPVIWSEEAARFLMIWIAFIGSSIAFRRKALVNFEFFLNLLPKKVYRLVMIFIEVSTLVFLLWFLKIGIESLELFSKSTASATQISLFWPASGLIVGGMFMLLHSVYFLVEKVVNFNLIEEEVPN